MGPKHEIQIAAPLACLDLLWELTGKQKEPTHLIHALMEIQSHSSHPLTVAIIEPQHTETPIENGPVDTAIVLTYRPADTRLAHPFELSVRRSYPIDLCVRLIDNFPKTAEVWAICSSDRPRNRRYSFVVVWLSLFSAGRQAIRRDSRPACVTSWVHSDPNTDIALLASSASARRAFRFAIRLLIKSSCKHSTCACNRASSSACLPSSPSFCGFCGSILTCAAQRRQHLACEPAFQLLRHWQPTLQ